ncbi:hypothetical protein WA026_022196 [Henosepilachna vigintioctopunctata]|uniref:Uncharacterized protein n=1 Tax=Henosepilachna vigintioctopunctata TaxID=420089 RepID=A0AAW1UN13_9CUCU
MKELEITREHEMKHHIQSLLKKTSPNNKDVLQVISLMGLDGKNQRDAPIGELNMFQELPERTNRARNIMIFNVEGSNFNKVKDRASHDKSQILELLTKLDVEPVDFRVYRIGRTSLPRPVKVIFNNPSLPAEILRKKFKLIPSGVKIKNDLTQFQRIQMKEVYAELKRRKENGEEGLIVRYRNNAPVIMKEIPPRPHSSVETKND